MSPLLARRPPPLVREGIGMRPNSGLPWFGEAWVATYLEVPRGFSYPPTAPGSQGSVEALWEVTGWTANVALGELFYVYILYSQYIILSSALSFDCLYPPHSRSPPSS